VGAAIGTGEKGVGDGMGLVDGSLYTSLLASRVGWGVSNMLGIAGRCRKQDR
jgi:hypothetical protein